MVAIKYTTHRLDGGRGGRLIGNLNDVHRWLWNKTPIYEIFIEKNKCIHTNSRLENGLMYSHKAFQLMWYMPPLHTHNIESTYLSYNSNNHISQHHSRLSVQIKYLGTILLMRGLGEGSLANIKSMVNGSWSMGRGIWGFYFF